MKNLLREQNIENLERCMDKATYLKRLSFISLTIDLIFSIAIEILKLIYYDKGEYESTLYFFIAKVKI
jgi:hypothetical protein